ncbi:MAG TPA: HigA family addiction module antitoxin [Candidatus Binatus sp.]|uniref:HigA family addiction module antitoxin n=1 Tax=Candidatus Binatus sp. TaxID=2811406 RepID=UPI002B465F52|nr:HigA family addiction module antitoxin [Candidatus Binatus sp.]HKN12120.1 HigA family addiction module antitoxin [Candidatus Binatus sp.]
MARKKKIPPLHPGEVLHEDFIVPTGISIHRLAMDLRVPANRIGEIVKGERAISADTALRSRSLSRHVRGILARIAE